MRTLAKTLVVSALLLGMTSVRAADDDLDRIPAADPSMTAADSKDAGSPDSRVYIERALTVQSLRDDFVVPPPGPHTYYWQLIALADIRDSWALTRDTRLNFSDRFNVRNETDLPFPTHEDLANDLRELYLSWAPTDTDYVDVGRVNLKSGIALGYNPTDFFKTRTVTEPLSSDPSVLREDRLGTVMLSAQHIWSGGSILGAFAPFLHEPSAVYSNQDLPSFNPMLDRTNPDDRFLIKATANLTDNLSPEMLLYRESGVTHFGTNLSYEVGQSVVAYFEWAGADRTNLASEAIAYGKETGSIPAGAPDLLPVETNRTLKSEYALGASYTTADDITWNFEYHVNQAGFSKADWDHWFSVGEAAGPGSPAAAELWYIRGYTVDQQQQFTDRAAFVRVDWVDAFGIKLDLSGFALTDLHDGSAVLQFSANYYLSDKWTLAGQLLVNEGSRRSDFGSLENRYAILIGLTTYLP